MKFILASSSPRRRDLFGSLGIAFTVIKPDIDEMQHPGEPPLAYVMRLSYQKAAAVATIILSDIATQHSASENVGEGIVLAADTVVILGADTLGVDEHGDILGKPLDADDARDMLRRLRGRTHQVCTAITLLTPIPPTPFPRIQRKGEKDNPADAAFSPSLNLTKGNPVGAGTRMRSGGGVITRTTCTAVTMRDYSDAEIDDYIATGDPFDKAGSYAIQHPIFQPVARIDGCYSNVVGLPVCTLKNLLADIGWPGMAAVVGCDCDQSLLRA